MPRSTRTVLSSVQPVTASESDPKPLRPPRGTGATAVHHDEDRDDQHRRERQLDRSDGTHG